MGDDDGPGELKETPIENSRKSTSAFVRKETSRRKKIVFPKGKPSTLGNYSPTDWLIDIDTQGVREPRVVTSKRADHFNHRSNREAVSRDVRNVSRNEQVGQRGAERDGMLKFKP
ncbi:hypothetical protein PM082_010751 [Marasmius tenuissimus]|nr:hypothetical protein PM082_010751 [Marasmius tenuissimus]